MVDLPDCFAEVRLCWNRHVDSPSEPRGIVHRTRPVFSNVHFVLTCQLARVRNCHKNRLVFGEHEVWL
jgi:hypothetical protein